MALSSNFYCADDADDFAGERLHSLLAAEEGYMPQSEYISRYLSCSLDLTARQDAINWILKVSEFYRFRPVTVYLSINYLDRFLSVKALPGQNGKKHCAGSWPMQLLSVACLSVAAKMEETNVPLLLDLQILNPEFVFDPRTVCRMELLLMSSLHWRMRAVTPFDFISYFSAAIVFADGRSSVLSPAFSRSADLILSTHRVIDFLGFRPSVIAAAALLCAASEVSNSSATYDYSIFDDWVSKETLSECRQLMEEYLIDTCPSVRRDAAAALPAAEPLSPVGVLDAAACGSCDTLRSSAADKPNSDAGGSDSPPAKRSRLADGFCTGIISTRSYG